MRRIDTYWTTEDVAKKTGVAVGTVKWWIKIDRIPSFKLGRYRRFDPEEIKSWWADACRGVR